MNIHMRYRYLHIPHSLIQGGLSTQSSPDFIVLQIPIMFLPNPLTIQQNHWLQPMNQCAIIHLAISPSKQNKQLSALVEVLPTGRTPLHGCPSGLSQRGCSFAAVHFWWYLHILQDHLESGPKEKSWVS